jgi:hypothetical protein
MFDSAFAYRTHVRYSVLEHVFASVTDMSDRESSLDPNSRGHRGRRQMTGQHVAVIDGYAQRPHGLPEAEPRSRESVVRFVAGAAFLVGATLLLIGASGMPVRSADSPRGSAVTLVLVRDGETLSDIAARIDGGAPSRATVQAIRELNALTSSDLSAGATLRVPAGYATESALASR